MSRQPRIALTALLTAVASIFAGTACETKPAPPPDNAVTHSLPLPPPTASKPATHEHHAPHGGTLIELGEEFAHVELVLDAPTGKLTAYVLDGEAEKAVRIPQPKIEMQLRLDKSADASQLTLSLAPVANPLTGETIGDTSQFIATHERLKNVTDFDGVLSRIAVKGSEFRDVKFNFPKGNE